MEFKETDQHKEHRYQNAKVLLSSLIELDYFYNNYKPALGIQAIAKLSPEEREAMYDILSTIYRVCDNLKDYDDKFIHFETKSSTDIKK